MTVMQAAVETLQKAPSENEENVEIALELLSVYNDYDEDDYSDGLAAGAYYLGGLLSGSDGKVIQDDVAEIFDVGKSTIRKYYQSIREDVGQRTLDRLRRHGTDNANVDSCYFCDESSGAKVETHNIIPKRLKELGWQSDKSVALCPSCHRKFHRLTDEFIEFLTDPSNKQSRAPGTPKYDNTNATIASKIRATINGQNNPSVESVVDALANDGVDGRRVKNRLRELMQDGVVYDAGNGRLKVSDSEWSDRMANSSSATSGGGGNA